MTILKPSAVIVDVDGSLVDVSSIQHHTPRVGKSGVYPDRFDFSDYHREAVNCPPIPESIKQVQAWADQGHKVLIATARSQIYGRQTAFWLAMHQVPSDLMIMRHKDDQRPDAEVKRDFWKSISSRFYVVAAIEDNPRVVDLWMEVGVPEIVFVPGYPV